MFGEENQSRGEERLSRQYHAGFSGGGRTISLLQKAICLCSGALAQIGWAFLALGSVFTWIFMPMMDISPITHFGAEYSETSGQVIKVVKTKASEGGSDTSDGTPIYANHFRASIEGHSIEGVSYSVGQRSGAGSAVKIEYIPGRPDTANIVGQRRNMFPPYLLFILLFPAIGLLFVVLGIKRGRKHLHLLAHGTTTIGTFLRREATNTRINNSTVYRYYFGFKDTAGQQREAQGETHRRDVFRAEENETTEVLYDPFNSSSAVLVQTISGGLKIDPANSIVNGVASYFSLLLPLLALAANAIAAHLVL